MNGRSKRDWLVVAFFAFVTTGRQISFCIGIWLGISLFPLHIAHKQSWLGIQLSLHEG